MTITQVDIPLDFRTINYGFSVADHNCAAYSTGTGFYALGDCNGSGNRSIAIINPAYPLDNNQRLIGLHGYATYGGPRGSSGIGLGIANSISNVQQQIKPVGGGQIELAVSVDSGAYGAMPSIVFFVNAIDDGSFAYALTELVLTVLVDDSIAQGQPPVVGNGPPPQHYSNDCKTNLTYQYGIGPNCLDIGDTAEFISGNTNIGNILSVIFNPPATLSFLYADNWDPTKVPEIGYFLTENPLGNKTFSFDRAAYADPSKIPVPIEVAKLEIFGPNQGSSFNLFAKVLGVHGSNSQPPVIAGGDLAIQQAIGDSITKAINDESTNVGQKIDNGLNDFKNSIQDLITNFPTQLFSAFISGVTGLPQSTTQNLLANIKIPPELIDRFVTFIQDLISTEGIAFTKFISTLGINNLAKVDSNIVGQTQSFNGTLSAQETVVNNLLKGQYVNADSFFNDLKGAGNDVALLEWLQNAYLLVVGTFEFLKSKTDIADIVTKQLLLGQYTPLPNDLATLINIKFRGQITQDELYSEGARLGLSHQRIDNALLASTPLPPIDVITQDFMRGYINEQQHDGFLGRRGFSLDDIKLIKASYNIIPPPTDITRMADKHIFSSDIPTYFGQYTEIPQPYIDAMKQWGLGGDWTNKLWAAHWSLPGLQDVFSMFHRGIITEDQLNGFFSLTDILPFFREQLKKLNYSLITRVDIRRFYAEGVFTEAQVKDAYIKLGFDATNADLQTQFTVLHERASELPAKIKIKNLTESLVVKAYKSNVIGKQEAINRLGLVGYLPNDASIILDLENQLDNSSILADKTQHYHDRLLNHILASFSKATISEAEARQYLLQIGVPSAEVESELTYTNIERVLALKEYAEQHVRSTYSSGQLSKVDATNLLTSIGFNMSEILFLFQELDLVRNLRNKPLSETQLKEIYGANLITPQELYDEFVSIGYNDKHANWLTQTIVKA